MMMGTGVTWLKNRAKWASSTALSTSASSQTMKGDFPPSSKVTDFRLLLAANSRTTFPVTVEPVKASCKKTDEKNLKIAEFGLQSKQPIHHLEIST